MDGHTLLRQDRVTPPPPLPIGCLLKEREEEKLNRNITRSSLDERCIWSLLRNLMKRGVIE